MFTLNKGPVRLHGGGGPQVGEVARLGGVNRLSNIISHFNFITFAS